MYQNSLKSCFNSPASFDMFAQQCYNKGNVSYNTVGQIYQNSLKSHFNSPEWEKMTTLKVQEYLFGK